MLEAILVLQAFIIVLFLVLSIVGWQKLTGTLTEKLETSTEKLGSVYIFLAVISMAAK